MMQFKLDAVATLLNFVGSGVLALDALQAGRRAYRKLGQSFWGELRKGPSFAESGQMEIRIARVTLGLAILGLSLLTIGLLLDLYSKTTGNNPVIWTWS